MRDSRGRFVAGDAASARVGGCALQRQIRQERETLRQIVADIWARRAADAAHGDYQVVLDADLCAHIRRALGEGGA